MLTPHARHLPRRQRMSRTSKWLKIAVALASAAVSADARASDAVAALVTQILTVNSTGLFYFATSGSRTTPPSCATSANWVVNITSAQGQAVMATVISAKMSGKSLAISGINPCPNDSAAETVNYVVVP